ncbi:MAG: hypothetical protein ACYS9X_10705, partial [Planctomycetota bacterium]
MGRGTLLTGGVALALACSCVPARRRPSTARPTPPPEAKEAAVPDAPSSDMPDAPTPDAPKAVLEPGPCVSPEGDDAGPGTEGKPFATLERALRELAPGETVNLLPGVFPEPVTMKGVKGTAERPIVIRAQPGAVLDGTRRLEARWTKWRDGIWRARIGFDVWQLFISEPGRKDGVGRKLVCLARWPDASFEGGSIWRMTRCMRSTDHGWDRKRKAHKGRTRPGTICDAPFKEAAGAEFREGDADYGAT